MSRAPSHLLKNGARLFACLAVLLLWASLPARAVEPLAGLGQKRALLLFAKSRSDASLDRQLGLLSEQRLELSERSVVVIVIAGGQEAMIAMGYATLPAGAGNALFKAFKPAPQGVTVVLVPGPAGEKQRWQQPVMPEELFAVIDALPPVPKQ